MGGQLPGHAYQHDDQGGLRMTGTHQHRVAAVTGGASGMGEASCHELGRRGYRVAFWTSIQANGLR
jgi:hypothetical protein